MFAGEASAHTCLGGITHRQVGGCVAAVKRGWVGEAGWGGVGCGKGEASGVSVCVGRVGGCQGWQVGGREGEWMVG